jgi:2-hydroxy-3-keto-5-methylthiopentenyl-1-phosphate phosphatase
VPQPDNKTVVQLDFDGTVTMEDVSFMLLDAFAEGDWRKIHEEYHVAHMTVGEFNSRVFGLVRASKETMLGYMKGHVVLREGLPELAMSCRRKGYRLVIVSNGLDFYIEHILKGLGLEDVEFHAARTLFNPSGLKVDYINPEGKIVLEGLKDTYVRLFRDAGCRVIYAGDGHSDFAAASLAQKIFAIDGLLKHCREVNVPCVTFSKLTEIAEYVEKN